mgnify:CR=1 FL=1
MEYAHRICGALGFHVVRTIPCNFICWSTRDSQICGALGFHVASCVHDSMQMFGAKPA